MTAPTTPDGEATPVERVLPDPNAGCVCSWESEDRGGGCSELVAEYEPACPVHSEHLYDPRTGVWIERADVTLAGDWLERVLGEHCDFTYVDTPADPAHFVCDCGHAFGYEDGAHAEWEAHLAAAIRTAAGVGL